MKPILRRHPRRIIFLLLFPLLLLVVMQAAISFGTVILGGTFSSLRENAAERLEQVTETRQIIFEDKSEQWSGMNEEYLTANSTLNSFLAEKEVTLAAFLEDGGLQEEFLDRLLPTWVYLMRTNATTGAFLVLAGKTQGNGYAALYLRDNDPDSNPADYSDVLLAVGPSSVSQAHQIPLDLEWTSRLALEERGTREADEFFYAPYDAALAHPGQQPTDLCYWSRPFRLMDNPEDSHRMITCSIPLFTENNEVWGVMGIEISLSHLGENLPYREVDSDHRGGYLLLEDVGDGRYAVVYASGPNAAQFTMDLDEISPEPEDGLAKVTQNGKDYFLALKPIRLYNTNTPFYERGWYLAGLEDRVTLFGFSDSLARTFSVATAISLLIALALALLLAHLVTRPIRRLSACIRNSTGTKLGDFPQSDISEVNELYGTIKSLTDRQRQTEFDLLEEKERYRVALQSSSDILISHDIAGDRTIFHNLHGDGMETAVTGLLSGGSAQGYIHPDDLPLLPQTDGAEDGISLSFRFDLSGGGGNYRWYALNGRILRSEDGTPKTLIGAMHDIHDQKMQELALAEARLKDPLTGLLLPAAGEEAIRGSLHAGHGGCLILFDVRGLNELNRNIGIVAGNLVLEEVALLLGKGTEDVRRILVRAGGDEFLLWLEDCNGKEAEKLAAKLCERAERLYQGAFSARLSCGCAEAKRGEHYGDVLTRACAALLAAKNSAAPVLTGPAKEPQEAITPIEYFAPVQGIVPLTFSMFDKGGDAGTVLSVLFPKLHRAFGASDIILSELDRDFFTVTATYQWHRSAPRDSELLHYSAEEFAALQEELWTDSSAKDLKSLTPAQRRFLRAPEGQDGLAFPLYDSGNDIGALLFLKEGGFGDDAARQLYEIVKIIESNLNKQRYDSASRAKSDFLSRMSHEIRTPMNAIIGMTYLAKTHLGDGEAVREDLDKIDQSSHYLLGLINDILDMSRIESGKMTLEHAPFDLSLMLSGVGDLIVPQAEAKQIRYTLRAEVREPWVTGDVLRLKQVLINLLGNAVKFTPDGGEISLTVRQDRDGTVLFSVKDTGIGISPENRERIFHAFEQAETSTVRKYGGTGLGLSISSRLVRMMGGVIELTGEAGRGSDFHFTIGLPVCASPEAAPALPKEEAGSIEGVKILLVEDNELNIEIAQSILEMEGAIVTLARNGQEAVDRFTASGADEFDLILMDIQMPVMDGLEATKRIRRSAHPAAADIPIIAMTANAFDEDMKRSVESGMNGHLSKPLDFDKLIAAIQENC